MALGGLLAGAVGGLGQAMQGNAQGQIEEKRQRALMTLEQGMAMERQDDQQQFTAGENQANREFKQEEGLLNRNQDLTLAQMRERGANGRAAMSRNDWEVMQTNDGSLMRINSRTGDIQPMDAPPGANFGGGGWSDRDQAYMDSLQAEMDSLQEVAKTSMLSDEQQQRMQAIPQEMRTYASGIDADDEVLGTYSGMRGGGQQDGPPPSIARPVAQGDGENADNGTSAAGYLNDRQQQQAEAERNREADTRVSEMTSEAKRIAGRLTIPDQFDGGFQRGGLLNRAAGRGIDQQAERQAAQQVLADVAAEHDAETDDARKAQLKEAMDALLDAGVTLPQ